MSTREWADFRDGADFPPTHCRSCGHARHAHSDDKAPQGERGCAFLLNGTRCPCTYWYVEDVPEPVATEHDDFEGAPV